MTFRSFAFALPAVLSALLGAGCASRMVNLTPRTAAPTRADVYRFEVQWDTSRRGVNNAEVKAYVMIEESLYPMHRMEGTPDRWEGDVPVPTGKPVISYRYKFDYTYPAIRSQVPQSDLSPPYFLDLNQGTAPKR